MKVHLRRLAEIELNEAVDFYEHRQQGLGQRFANKVLTVLKEIETNPKRFAEAEEGVREAPLLDFPYAIYYQIVSNRVDVISVFHTSRDPNVWQRRVL